jgi:hypothetical protein
MLRLADFHPPCCEHSLCSFSATYVLDGAGGLGPVWTGSTSCCGPKTVPASPLSRPTLPPPIIAAEGARQSKAFVVRQWGRPPKPDSAAKLSGPTDDFERFLSQSGADKRFSVSAMAFQDAWTLDLDRAKGCCIHVATPDHRLVPFCLYNLTAADGRPLYRNR